MTTALILPEGGYLQPGESGSWDIFMETRIARPIVTLRIIVPGYPVAGLYPILKCDDVQQVLNSTAFELVASADPNVIELRRTFALGQQSKATRYSAAVLDCLKLVINQYFRAQDMLGWYFPINAGEQTTTIVVPEHKITGSQGDWLIFAIPNGVEIPARVLEAWRFSYCQVNSDTGAWEVGARLDGGIDAERMPWLNFTEKQCWLRAAVSSLLYQAGIGIPDVIFRSPNPSNPL